MNTVAVLAPREPTSRDTASQCQGSKTVIILERDGSLVRSSSEIQHCSPTSGYAELSADLVQQPNNLIDRILSFAFDTLGLTTLEMRVREQE